MPVNGSTPAGVNSPAFFHKENSVISPTVALCLSLSLSTVGVILFSRFFFSSVSYFFILENLCLDSQLYESCMRAVSHTDTLSLGTCCFFPGFHAHGNVQRLNREHLATHMLLCKAAYAGVRCQQK